MHGEELCSTPTGGSPPHPSTVMSQIVINIVIIWRVVFLLHNTQ